MPVPRLRQTLTIGIAVGITAMLLGGCAGRDSAVAPAAGADARSVSEAELHLPATFRGVLPCADCEGIRHHLDLWPDNVFHLRREWLGRAFVRDELGRWRIDPARRALILEGGGEMPLQFEVLDVGRLRQLDMDGRPIVSQLPYELASDGTLSPTDLDLLLGGEMTYMADAARFTENLTGRSYPIAFEADFIAMERAYREAVSAPGAPLYVSFEGSLTRRPRADSSGTEPAIVVRRFINVWPERRAADVPPDPAP